MREIKVEVEGKITDRLIDDFNKRLAIALIAQYSRKGAELILEELRKE
ncbi:hypothetical protein ABHA37_07995 [Clostridium tertium]|nr:hypothetical protein [Clostridium tertium]MDB1923353.1 hypothetical protein [Clostridium tertium]MDB1929958.1 hypothetical protein [Clostridium tertium]